MGEGQQGWTSWDLEGQGEVAGLFSPFFWPHRMHSMWDLSPSTKDQTRTPCLGSSES